MISTVRVLLAVLVLGILAPTVRAVTADNPYHTIVDRNPFGLNPPPPPSTNDPTATPPKNVKFNGITKAAGHKRALFTIPGKDAKEPPQYVTLAEGEKADVLEVSKISEDEGEVEVVNSGIKMVLNFKNNGNKGATIAPQPGVPGQPMPPPAPLPGAAPNPAAAVFTPGMQNPAVARPVGEGAMVEQGVGNPGIVPNTGGQPQYNPGQPAPPEGLNPNANFGGGLNRIPTRTLRLNPQPPPPPP